MYFALLSAIVLGAGFILHGLVSLASLAAWRIFRSSIDAMVPRHAARVLLLLRMAPLVVSVAALVLFVVPSFLEFEPPSTSEPVSYALLLMAGATALIVAGSASRAIVAIIQSRRVMRRWLSVSRPELGAVQFYRGDLGAPVIAVMGIWRSRIFASEAVYNALSPEELRAALLHETVHAGAFDVLKKMFLQLAPAFFPGVDLLKPVSTHWSRMSELAADEQSVAGDPQHTLNLASALVKVARLARPHDELPTLSAALVQRSESLLGYRVRRLLEISEHPETLTANAVDFRKFMLVAACLSAMLLAAYPQVLSVTHELLEFLVQG